MNGVGQDIELDRGLDFKLSREDTVKTVDVLMGEKSRGLIDVD